MGGTPGPTIEGGDHLYTLSHAGGGRPNTKGVGVMNKYQKKKEKGVL